MRDRFIKLRGRLAAGLLIVLSVFILSACAQKTGDAIVTGKEHIEAADNSTPQSDRATNREQWIVTVETRRGGRKINVQTDQSQWDKLKVGDGVLVSYREGKYTGTVWDAEIR